MVLIITFIVTMIVGVPICYVLGLVGAAGLVSMGPTYFSTVAQKLFASANNYSLMAIPMFILAGELMGLSGDVHRLMDFCRSIIGRIRGGIAYVCTIVGLLLGGILGMANAEAALLSSTIYPEMLKDGYEDTFSACFIGSVSVVGPLIPPGLLYVIYGVASGTPIASLFESGVIPGILVAIALMSVIFVLSRKPGCPWKTHEWKGWKHVLHCFKDAAFSIVAPFLTFVCIAAGITTATEAASVIIVFVLLVGTIVYKKIKFKDLLPMMIRSAVMSAAILMIASMAGVMGWVLAIDQIPQKICNLMISMTNSRIAVLFIIQIFLLFVGMFMDAAPAVLILVPVFMPIMKQYGIDPVHFGLLMCFNLTIGVLTPPVGTCLYTTAMATGVPVDRMIKGIWPWIGVLVVVLFICTYWEGLILFIPRLPGYGVYKSNIREEQKMIKNEHHINDFVSSEIRKANETRGLWYYELVQSAGKYGLDKEQFARAAIRKLGNLYRGGYPDTDSVPEFMGAFLNDHNIKQFHMELVSLTDDEAVVHFHYCPMCGAWTKLTDNEKEIGMICDCAMDVDRGVFDLYEHIGFKLEKAIGCGDNVCELHFVRK